MRRPARPPAARDYAAMTRATASFSMPAGSGQRHDPPAAGGRRERDHTRHGRRAPPIVHRGRRRACSMAVSWPCSSVARTRLGVIFMRGPGRNRKCAMYYVGT